MKFKVTHEFEISQHDIEGILEEAPIGYWGKYIDKARTTVKLNDPESHKGKTIFKVDLAEGMSLLPPARLQNFMREEWDGEDEDCLIQLATMGEVVFG